MERLASVVSDPSFVLPNGDELQFLTLTFRCRYVSGDPRVMDDENLEVRWFGLDALPTSTTRPASTLLPGSSPRGRRTTSGEGLQ